MGKGFLLINEFVKNITKWRKGAKRPLCVLLVLSFVNLVVSPACIALPEIEEIKAGSAEITKTDSTLTINASDNTIINYKSFDIQQGESVIVNLPGAYSDILNRVTGSSQSFLGGSLSCNGLFILVNTNGIHIASTASINSGSFVASTRNITDANFLNSQMTSSYVFEKASSCDRLLLNEGSIKVADGGFSVLIGGAVENKGAIIARLGTITLAGGDMVTLTISKNGMVSIVIDEETASQILDSEGNPVADQIKNTGKLGADGGAVILAARSANGIFRQAINLEGCVEANNVDTSDGIVRIFSDGDVRFAADISTPKVEISGIGGDMPGKIRLDKSIDADLYLNGINLGKGTNISGMPLYFIPNYGQVPDPDVKFYIQLEGLIYYFTPTAVYFMVMSESEWIPVRLSFAECCNDPELSSAVMTQAVFNYFLGDDPDAYTAGVPSYYQIAYSGLYEGIDLLYTSKEGNLESEFVVKPGADYTKIRLEYSNIASLERDSEGNLIIVTDAGTFTEAKPYVYQDIDGTRNEVSSRYVLLGDNSYSFELGEYDTSRPLVIDPTVTLSGSTYLGGSGTDNGRSIAVDSSGNYYICGTTGSANFPLLNQYQGTLAGGTDIAVAKFNSSGQLLYSTYLGGSSNDNGYAIDIDSAGKAYVAGDTYSTNFPTLNAYQSFRAGSTDGVVAKFTSSGGLEFSTYFGGNSSESLYAIAVDASGNAYVAGATYSTNIPMLNPYQATRNLAPDGFVAKFTSSGGLAYSTYLGGSGLDLAYGIAVDSSGSAYVAGYTSSVDFPVLNAFRNTNSGLNDGFVTKFSPAGNTLAYSTYIGGTLNDVIYDVDVDSGGKAFITGYTYSADWPLLNPYQAAIAGGQDIFVSALNASGDSLAFSTYLGGTSNDIGNSIAVDSKGNVYATGQTLSGNFPVLNEYQAALAGSYDAIVVKYDSEGVLKYSTYFGGSLYDTGYGITVDGSDNAYITGRTDSANLPLESAYQAVIGGGQDMFAAKMNLPSPYVPPTPSPSPETPEAGQPAISGNTMDMIYRATESARYSSLSMCDNADPYCMLDGGIISGEAYLEYLAPYGNDRSLIQ